MKRIMAGSRVEMIMPGSKYYRNLGVVKCVFLDDCDEYKVVVNFDCNSPDHEVTFPLSYFELTEECEKSIQQQRGEKIYEYSEWFAKAYQSIIEAGGNPVTFLDKMPPDIIDSMIRNRLFIVYDGPIAP